MGGQHLVSDLFAVCIFLLHKFKLFLFFAQFPHGGFVFSAVCNSLLLLFDRIHGVVHEVVVFSKRNGVELVARVVSEEHYYIVTVLLGFNARLDEPT